LDLSFKLNLSIKICRHGVTECRIILMQLGDYFPIGITDSIVDIPKLFASRRDVQADHGFISSASRWNVACVQTFFMSVPKVTNELRNLNAEFSRGVGQPLNLTLPSFCPPAAEVAYEDQHATYHGPDQTCKSLDVPPIS
jgi:hypothetical protein